MVDLPQIEIGAEILRCRLCDGPTSRAFKLTLLGKYSVGYWRCDDCASLQTEAPYWLDETYAAAGPVRDTGMVARTLQMAQATSALLAVIGVTARTRCLDFGGGNGLFCRMMRDQGYDFFSYDKHARPFYNIGFTDDLRRDSTFDVTTSFEVLEHLPNPRTDLEALLAVRPKIWIVSTQLYQGQQAGWDYLSPATGAHIFFYSEKAMHDFAGKHGFVFMPGRYLHMFRQRDDNPFLVSGSRLRLAQQILSGGRLGTLATLVHFAARQRRAYLRWQADRDAMQPTL